MMRRCVDRSGRRFYPSPTIGEMLRRAQALDQEVQKDQGGTKMEPYSTYAEVIFILAIVGLFSTTYVLCDFASKVIEWRRRKKPQ